MRRQIPIRAQRGETLVEFALGLTLLMTVLFGTLSFGIGVWRYSMVSDLAQEGARRAAVCGSKTGLTTSDCNISSYLTARAIGLTVGVTVCKVVSGTRTCPVTLSTLAAGTTVEVQVQNTFRPFTSLVPAGTLTLSSTSQMVVAR